MACKLNNNLIFFVHVVYLDSEYENDVVLLFCNTYSNITEILLICFLCLITFRWTK